MRLNRLVARVLMVSEEDLSPDSNAENTRNWDSARHVELLLAVETAFDVRFSTREVNQMRSLGDMRKLLQDKGVDLDLHARMDKEPPMVARS